MTSLLLFLSFSLMALSAIFHQNSVVTNELYLLSVMVLNTYILPIVIEKIKSRVKIHMWDGKE